MGLIPAKPPSHVPSGRNAPRPPLLHKLRRRPQTEFAATVPLTVLLARNLTSNVTPILRKTPSVYHAPPKRINALMEHNTVSPAFPRVRLVSSLTVRAMRLTTLHVYRVRTGPLRTKLITARANRVKPMRNASQGSRSKISSRSVQPRQTLSASEQQPHRR